MPRTIKVKPLDEIKEHYRRAAPEAARRYREAADRVVWKERAKAGHTLWRQRMADPDVLDRHLEGIDEVSDSEFRATMKEKGAAIIGARMAAAAEKQAKGYAPIRAAIEGLEIPDKGPDPYANVDNILKPVIRAMRVAAGKE